jgi:hypothetical protein
VSCGRPRLKWRVTLKIYVRDGLDRILVACDRDVAGSCEIGNENSISINGGNFLNN